MKLIDVCELIVDCPHSTAKDEGQGIPLVRTPNIGKGRLELAGVHRVSEKVYNQRIERATPKAGDLILAREAPVGNVALIMPGQIVCLGQRVVLIRPDNEKVDAAYLTYYLLSEEVQHRLINNANGAVVAHLNMNEIRNLEIDLPELFVQKRIAGILSSLDDKISLNSRINHNLEEQIQERFDSMIMSDNGQGYCQMADYVDVNPKRCLKKNEPAKCVDMSYLSTTGPFPSGWETKGYNGGMKFMNGDTIMARITPCLENGKVAYVNFLDDGEVAFGSTEYVVLHAKEGVSPVFTYFLARNKNFVDYATKNMNGSSGRQRVSGDTIEKYLIPVIDSDSINEFTSYATPAMEVIRNNSFESRSLAATRDAMLPLLFSGKLSISQMNV